MGGCHYSSNHILSEILVSLGSLANKQVLWSSLFHWMKSSPTEHTLKFRYCQLSQVSYTCLISDNLLNHSCFFYKTQLNNPSPRKPPLAFLMLPICKCVAFSVWLHDHQFPVVILQAYLLPTALTSSLLPLDGMLFIGKDCFCWAHTRYLIKVYMNGFSSLIVEKNHFMCILLSFT